jgi:hypothetical protein
MAHDQEIVKQLQQRFPDWEPGRPCTFHYEEQCCVYDESGRLIELHLCDLKLVQTPLEVWQCSSLQRLCLCDNQLSTLPAEVGNLSSLQELYLSHNQLSTLPAEVGNLSSLQKLYLSHNQLSTLPVEVGNLSSLRWLGLLENPLQSPLPEIIVQGIPALLAYLRTLQPIKIFYCYAHEDRDLRDRIDKHLGVLKRRGQVVVWYDREIQAGMEWEREIERHLNTAHIILLLVSADFVNSDYYYGKEMQRALEMHERGKVHVLPILLRPVDWQGAPFAKLQLLPTGAKPITRWTDPEEALEDVARQIRAVVTTLRTHQS